MRVGWVHIGLLLATGCAADQTQAADGTEGGGCYGDDTCDPGLQCFSDLCVFVPDAGSNGPRDAGPDTRDSTDHTPETPDADPDVREADASDATDAASDAGRDTDDPTDADGDDAGNQPDARDPDAAHDAAPDTPAPAAFEDVISPAVFDQMFLHKDDPACAGGIYTYENLAAAAAAFPAFGGTGSVEVRKRELAAFLANISHETTGGWPAAPDGPAAWGLCFVQEVGCEGGGCTGYCDAGNRRYPCAPGKTYHGRGAMQLSWNYNYGLAGEQLGEDLLANPDLVATDGRLAFLTAVWFWMTPQSPKPSAHDVMTGGWTPTDEDRAAGRLPGFGATVNIINGGLECNRPTDGRVEDRVAFLRRYAQLLGVPAGDNLYCDNMQPF